MTNHTASPKQTATTNNYNNYHHCHDHPPVRVNFSKADQRGESVVVRVAVHFLAGTQGLGGDGVCAHAIEISF